MDMSFFQPDNENLIWVADALNDNLKPRNFERQFYHYKGQRWRVKDLYEASKHLSVEWVPVESLAEKPWKAFEQKSRMDVARHIKLVLGANLDFPILLSSNGRIMDGNHRIVKAYLLGNERIAVKQFKTDPPPLPSEDL